MTNLQALSAICPFSANSLLFSKVLQDLGIDETATYSGASSTIELASAYVVKSLYIQANTSEGSLSVTHDKDKMRVYANSIFKNNRLYDEIIKNNVINII